MHGLDEMEAMALDTLAPLREARNAMQGPPYEAYGV